MSGELQGVRVLLAEDDVIIATHLSAVMEAQGASVQVVSSVMELSTIPPANIDVAVLDNTLADGEIGSQADRLRDAGVPLIHQSGDVAAVADKADKFIAILGKPINEDELISAIVRREM